MKRIRRTLATAAASAVIITSTFALALRQPDHLAGRPDLEVASGTVARAFVDVIADRVPPTALRGWTLFLVDFGADWRATWDSATKVPSRLWGSGMHVPGSVARADVAEAHARQILASHIRLLSPGAKAGDFVVVSNVVHNDMRTIGMVQTWGGMPVLGGQVNFRYKNDRLFVIGSEAFPNVASRSGDSVVSDQEASAWAKAWVETDAATSATVSAVEGPFVLPIVGTTKIKSFRTVLRVVVDASKPIGKWHVYVDAITGRPVAREQMLRFATGTVRYDVPNRYPGADRSAYPAQDADLIIDGAAIRSDMAGLVIWPGDLAASVVARVVGPLVIVYNDVGPDHTTMLTLDPDGEVVWDARNDELVEASVNTFIHARLIKDFARKLNPTLAWLDGQQIATVNIDDSCNAFSDGNTINFFQSSSECANTGQLADVVYHEFGHSLHANSIIPGVGSFDSAFSEGLSDYLAATFTNDPAMGRGFFKSSGPLRHIDPSNSEAVWPRDIAGPHTTGLIFGGAMWDLRKLLIQQLGETEGIARADRLYYAAVQRAANIPATYIEILAEDDDDGDLSNGTPNGCDINAAFGAHGLRTVSVELAPLAAELPRADGQEISLRITGLLAGCPGDGIAVANLRWEIRENSSVGETVAMTVSETDADTYVGIIPPAKVGDVVKFTIEVTFLDGTGQRFPDNPADPFYQFFVGEVEILYCTDFENDPFAAGWTHGLANGTPGDGADDWTWGEPLSPASSGDANEPFSGTRIIGNDLGGDNFNGEYQPDKTNFALSPVILVNEFEAWTDVRLQYWRWLNVEDAFFDQGTIYVNNGIAWQNFNSDEGNASALHHTDKEWRFHDVPISRFVGEDGTVQIKYELSSDGGLEFGGWNIDDFCIVANKASICGDDTVSGVETCDAGAANSDVEPDACRTNCQQAFCGDGIVDTGEQCDDPNDEECDATCGFVADEGSGCGCTVGSGDPRPFAGGLMMMLMICALLRRRRSN